MRRLYFCWNKNRNIRGQSLVELAISLPLFLLLIGGIVEVGNLLVQRQRITTATDMGARFGSRGGSDTGIYISAYNVLTQTMPIDEPELWDVFIVRGKVNDDGTGWTEFDTPVHVFGDGNTDLYADIISSTYPISLQTEILDGLQTRAIRNTTTNELDILVAGGGPGQSGVAGQQLAADEEVVGLIMAHNAKTILGIQNIFDQDFELTAQKYMTIHTVGEQTNGCDVYPIAISEGARNILQEENYYDDTFPSYVVTDVNTEPTDTPSQFIYPTAAEDLPLWTDFRPRSGNRGVLRGDFSPDDAIEGDIYILYEGEDFQWVYFGTDAAESTAALDLAWPGQSYLYDGYIGHPDGAFPNDAEGVHVRDRIRHTVGTTREGNPWAVLEGHIRDQRSMRLPVVEIGSAGLDTSGDFFKIEGFVILKIHGYGNGAGLNAGKRFIVTEVVKVDYSCGQTAG